MARDMVATGRDRSPPSSVKSFSRFEPSENPRSPRLRASTIQTGGENSRPGMSSTMLLDQTCQLSPEDVFDKNSHTSPMPNIEQPLDRAQSLPARFDELPVELVSLTDRFVQSLSAKVYSEPPTIETLSDLFQAFYVKASSHISTHIATLALRIERGTLPNQSPSAGPSSQKLKHLVKIPSKDSIASRDGPDERQMLTASEVAEKKKARKLLEYKRLALEEAVERRVCENVYSKIWRHKSTLDDVRDEKLRSKTAALALVGIGLKDLGIEIDQQRESAEEEIREKLAPARDELAKMNEERSPLGKLHRLTTAHKTIVETLSAIHSASSSADEILPTLIYTLITSPPEGINIISNLSFIERFRTSSKMDGEAAYCMTNLEAAVVFLENVDLASLREDELPGGPPKSPSRPPAQPTLQSSGSWPPASSPNQPNNLALDSNTMTVASRASTSTSIVSAPAPPSQTSRQPSSLHQRRLSNLLSPPAKALGAANDAVRNTAEEGFKNISSTLDSSFKFLFGRMREHSVDDSHATMPQTLEDAHKLVSPRLGTEDGSTSETSSTAEMDSEERTKHDDKLLSLVGGRLHSTARDRSVDSLRSNGSGRRAVSVGSTVPPTSSPAPNTPKTIETVKSISNSFMPLSHLGSAFGGSFKGFGRSTPTPPPVSAEKDQSKILSEAAAPSAATTTKHLEPAKLEAPIQRFLDLQEADDLTVRDVSILLHDYQRLAKAVQNLPKE